MAQEYTVEQLNHGRKVYDFMRWDYWAFGISGLLLIAAIVIMGVRGFNWGLDFTGGTVIEITLEKPAEIDVMRDALQKAGFEEPMLQNFGSSHDIMVRMPPAEGETGGQVLGSQVLKVINESTNQNAAVKRIEFVGPSVGADLAQTGAMALMVALISILIYNNAFLRHKMGMASAQAWVLFVIVCVLTAVAFVSQKKWVYYSDEDGR